MMAEVAASILGITTFGLQIGKRLYELRQLYSSIKSASEDIAHLLDECDRLNGILSTGLTHASQIASLLSSGIHLADCQSSCQTALTKLDGIARDLTQGISKAKLRGSFKAVLQHDTLDKLKARIDSTRTDLLLALQCLNMFLCSSLHV